MGGGGGRTRGPTVMGDGSLTPSINAIGGRENINNENWIRGHTHVYAHTLFVNVVRWVKMVGVVKTQTLSKQRLRRGCDSGASLRTP